ncbi:MAG: hypothetical protein IT349_16320 [Candidatus Eisenbacteria bacterium]|nr:hypothetical protein [Candidatus Eisenbacteria bacterium]
MKHALLVLTASACLTISARADVPLYQVQFLGAGWGASGLNENGDVCGNGTVDGSLIRAGVSHDGQPFELLPLPVGMLTSRAYAISDLGVIVGVVCPNQYVQTQPTAAVWRPISGGGYEVEILGGLPGDPYSAAWAVNNAGDIIGASGFWGWNPDHGILYTDSGPEPMPQGLLGADINDQRVVVSGNQLLDLDTGVLTTIPLPAGNWQGVASAAINENNDICGYIAGYSSCSIFPVRYQQATGWEILGGCAQTATSATALNDHGDALQYYYQTTDGVNFLGDGYFMLGSLIAPGQEYYVQYGGVAGINNGHQIVASARQGATGPIGAILMTPDLPASAEPLPSAEELQVRAVPNPSFGQIRLEGTSSTLLGGDWMVIDIHGRRQAHFSGRQWNGRSDDGARLPAGVYFLRSAVDAIHPPVQVILR